MLQKSVDGGSQQLHFAALLLQAERMALTVKQPSLAQARAYTQVMKSLATDEYTSGCLKNPTMLEVSDVAYYQAELLGYEENTEEVVRSFELEVADLIKKDNKPLPKYNCASLMKVDLSEIR